MTSILASHPYPCSLGLRENLYGERFSKIFCFGYSNLDKEPVFLVHWKLVKGIKCSRKSWPIFSIIKNDGADSVDSSGSDDEDESSKDETDAVNNELLRENLEKIVGKDDSAFSGIDLATLIRNKYGRSYDVQLIKKEFMGRNLLAMNVMWKYREQRSFPLTEEEYLLRLDDVANTLKCWGAVSHIRNSLAKLKERPRIGKAVSIFIDMDESGGRANEWIYK